MSIKSENQERWNDPAGQYDATKVNGMQIAYLFLIENEKEVEKTVDGAKMQRPVMGEIISSQLEYGMVIPVVDNTREEPDQETEIGG